MRLYLSGHDYKYAVEQMLLTLFPDERPEYPEGSPEGRRMEIRLSRTDATTSASCLYCTGRSVFRGAARASNDRLTDPLERDRICQRLIKNAMYRAALKSGVAKPAWGALTGVRPGKLMAGLVAECPDEKSALRSFISEFDVSPERAALCLATTRETLRAERARPCVRRRLWARGTSACTSASPSVRRAAPIAASSASRWRRACS